MHATDKKFRQIYNRMWIKSYKYNTYNGKRGYTNGHRADFSKDRKPKRHIQRTV